MCRYRATPNNFIHLFYFGIYGTHPPVENWQRVLCRVQYVCAHKTKHNPSPASHLLCVSEFYYLLLFYLRHHFCSTATSHHPPALTSDWKYQNDVVASNRLRTNPINCVLALADWTPIPWPFTVICVELIEFGEREIRRETKSGCSGTGYSHIRR